jgi:hypothetical protein
MEFSDLTQRVPVDLWSCSNGGCLSDEIMRGFKINTRVGYSVQQPGHPTCFSYATWQSMLSTPPDPLY